MLKLQELAPMPADLPYMYGLIDPPGTFGNTLASWEEFLAGLEGAPDTVQARQEINRARQVIAVKKWEYGKGH